MTSGRRTVSAATLAVTAVIVVIMAVWGVKAATAPLEDDASTTSSTTPDDDTVACDPGEQETVIKVMRRDEVTVSVYNAGKKAGRARTTLDRLENAGFLPGAIGNAPEGSGVAKAEVHAKSSEQTEAKLVAAAFGKGTPIKIDNVTDLGQGVDVYIGDKFKNLDRKAVKQVPLPEPRVECN